MKLLTTLCFLLAGCSTTVYGPNGKPQFRSYGNGRNETFAGPGTYWHVDEMDHSGATRAAFTGATSAVTAIGAAAAAGGLR